MFLYQQIFFSTVAVSFGILHLIIFLYNRRFKSNLFFAVFLFLYALNIFFDYQASLSPTYTEELIFLRLHRAVMPYNSVFVLLFLYYAFDFKIPKYFWLITTAIVITGFYAILDPILNFNYVQIPIVIATLEAFRICIFAIKAYSLPSLGFSSRLGILTQDSPFMTTFILHSTISYLHLFPY